MSTKRGMTKWPILCTAYPTRRVDYKQEKKYCHHPPVKIVANNSEKMMVFFSVIGVEVDARRPEIVAKTMKEGRVLHHGFFFSI